MSQKIQVKRGVKANLPVLSVGEPAFTTDTNEIFVGNGTTNIGLAKTDTATTTSNGLMSNLDKTTITNLPNITKGATINSVQEGNTSTANGDYSHAEGFGNIASSNYSHVEGLYNLACNGTSHKITAFNDLNKTITLDNTTGLVVGSMLYIKITDVLTLSGIRVTAISGLVVTLNTTATINSNWLFVVENNNQYPTHAEGNNTIANGISSHAEGNKARAVNNYSHAEGDTTLAGGVSSHSEGYVTRAIGTNSHAEGDTTTASGTSSHAEGLSTTAKYLQHVMGQFNSSSATTDTAYLSTGEAFIIGNGTSSSTLGNAFKVMFDGKTYADGAYASTGADYAEYFEWSDENSNNEDRVGFFVTLDGEHIRKANSTDDYILGIVSSTPSVIGDNYEAWKDKYVTDVFGRIQYHDVTVPAIYITKHHDDAYENKIIEEVSDGEGNIITPYSTESILVKEAYDEQVIEQDERIEVQPIYNAKWDSSQEYITRERRQEWSPIGMMGKLLVRDDGTCEVNGYCKSNDEGIATKSDSSDLTKYKVMKRVNDNIILILVK